ncbi:hypothetical protein JX266_003561 [Neoarthrinium moseri]|nr:hypothetical protein JX266_003561 [Neoarthrinium moseri]
MPSGKGYNTTSSGTNSQVRITRNGSYYYSNPNGSTYYNNGQGGSTYTSSSGQSYSGGSGKKTAAVFTRLVAVVCGNMVAVHSREE